MDSETGDRRRVIVYAASWFDVFIILEDMY
jgi:hypothetical protein